MTADDVDSVLIEFSAFGPHTTKDWVHIVDTLAAALATARRELEAMKDARWAWEDAMDRKLGDRSIDEVLESERKLSAALVAALGVGVPATGVPATSAGSLRFMLTLLHAPEVGNGFSQPFI